MPKLVEQVRDEMRTRHYSYRTEQTYIHWIKQFILFHGKRHPSLLGADEIGSFLTHLAVQRTVAASTQNQALAALLFLYRLIWKPLGCDAYWFRSSVGRFQIPPTAEPQTLGVFDTVSEVGGILNR